MRERTEQQLRSSWQWLLNLIRDEIGTFQLAGYAIAIVTAIIGFIVTPWFVGVATTLLLGIFAVYSRHAWRLMRAAQRDNAWRVVDQMKMRIDILERENRLDYAVLSFGVSDHNFDFRRATKTPELRAVIANLRWKLRQGTEPKVEPKSARVRKPAAPKEPDYDAIKRRIERRNAEIDWLEAQTEELATPESRAAAERELSARNRMREVSRRTAEADRAARELRRKGRAATKEPVPVLEIAIGPDRVPEVARKPMTRTPREIARGTEREQPREKE